jgi:psiF repeat
MSMIKTGLAAVALAFALSTSALAQTPPAPAAAKPAAPATAPAVTAPAKPGKPASLAKPRTDISLACSKQADEKKLHGTERKKFRADCMKPAAAKKN